jgi:hypothetical protein
VDFWPKIQIRSWSAALKDQDFASIADWFTYYLFSVGAVGLAAAGLAAGVEAALALELSPSSKTPGSIALLEGFAVGLRVFVLSLVFAAPSMVSGWLLGLLFGIPRTLARPSRRRARRIRGAPLFLQTKSSH